MDNTKLVIFDLDDTLIHQNSWIKLNGAMGMTMEEDEMLYKFYTEGIIYYSEWQDLLSSIYITRGNATKQKMEVALSDYKYHDGTEELIKHLKDKNIKLALLSGSISVIVELIAKELGFDYWKANNVMNFEGDKFVGMKTIGDDKLMKLQELESIVKKFNISFEEIVSIGDGDNDIELFKKTRGITFTGSKIEDQAWKVVESLRDIVMLI